MSNTNEPPKPNPASTYTYDPYYKPYKTRTYPIISAWTYDNEAMVHTVSDISAFNGTITMSATQAPTTPAPILPDWQAWAMSFTVGGYCPVCHPNGLRGKDQRYVADVDYVAISLKCNRHPMYPGSRLKTHTSWELVKAYYEAVGQPVPTELQEDGTWGEYGL